ncbi:MAG: 50S ribosome-binding GTPase [Phycisphaerales bacterium]|nr:50S ribosome-binding GTPase [Phycisphaerales bacterium]
MDTTSTIVASATPMAPGPRAVVRLSGTAAYDAINALTEGSIERTRGVYPIRLRLPIGVIPTLAVSMPGPNTYTGEDTIELLPPGSPTVVDAIVRAMLAFPGVRHAEAGEFTARAYLNGRLTLEQAEGVAATIAAANEQQLRASHGLLHGESGRRHASMVDELASALALVEAAADFAEEEHVVPISAGDLRNRLESLLVSLESESLGRRGREHAAARPMVVLAGEPNAGKTSLFNTLLGRTRAVVSSMEHATRDAIAEPLTLEHPRIGAVSFDLVDLPGLPDSLDAAERASVQAVLEDALDRADVVLQCDPNAQFGSIAGGDNTIRLRTKADSPESRADGCLEVSAKTGLNIETLKLELAEAIESSNRDVGAGLIPRHRDLADQASASVSRARAAIESDPASGPPIGGEIVAAEMRLALDLLGELGGRVHPDEVLGRIFASFCVGK